VVLEGLERHERRAVAAKRRGGTWSHAPAQYFIFMYVCMCRLYISAASGIDNPGVTRPRVHLQGIQNVIPIILKAK
jgi:hypothetical protein